jgi:hypothetical protein
MTVSRGFERNTRQCGCRHILGIAPPLQMVAVAVGGDDVCNRRCILTVRTVPKATVSIVAMTANATGIARTPSARRRIAMITTRPPSCALFVISGVRVSRRAMSPRVMTSVAT